MTANQLDALLAYIDARIEESLTRNSCGPHVSEKREISRAARRELIFAFGGKT